MAQAEGSVKFTGDVSDLLSALEDLDEALGNLEDRSITVSLDDEATDAAKDIEQTMDDLDGIVAEPTADLDDQASEQSDEIQQTLDELDQTVSEPTVELDDQATDVKTEIREGLDELDQTVAEPTVELDDQATDEAHELSSVLDEIDGRMMTATVDVDSSALDEVDGAAQNAEESISRVGTAADTASDQVNNMGDTGAEAGGLMEDHFLEVEAALLAIAAASEIVARELMDINVQIEQVGLMSGIATGEMRDLVTETANVTFPIEEVTEYFKLLSQLGVRSRDELKESATIMDEMGDAYGWNTGQVKEMVKVYDIFGGNVADLNKMTPALHFAFENMGDDIKFLLPILRMFNNSFRDMGFTWEESIIIISELYSKLGDGRDTTTAIRRAFREAEGDSKAFFDELGIGAHVLDDVDGKIGDVNTSTEEMADVVADNKTIIEKATHSFKEWLVSLGPIGTEISSLIGALSGLAMPLAALKYLSKGSFGALKKFAGKAFKKVKDGVSYLVHNMPASLKKIPGMFRDAFTKVGTVVSNALETVRKKLEAAKAKFAVIGQKIGAAFNAAKAKAMAAWDAIKNALATVKAKILAVKAKFEAAAAKIGAAYNAAKAKAMGAMEAISAALAKVKAGILAVKAKFVAVGTSIGVAYNKAKAVAMGASEAIIAALAKLKGIIAGTSKGFAAVGATLGTVFVKAKAAAMSVGGLILAALAKLKALMLGTSPGFFATGSKLGASTSAGFKAGLLGGVKAAGIGAALKGILISVGKPVAAIGGAALAVGFANQVKRDLREARPAFESGIKPIDDAASALEGYSNVIKYMHPLGPTMLQMDIFGDTLYGVAVKGEDTETALGNSLQNMYDETIGKFEGMGSFLEGWEIPSINWPELELGLPDVIGSIKEQFEGLGDWFSDLKTRLTDWFKNLFDFELPTINWPELELGLPDIIGSIKDLFDDFVEWLNQIPGRVSEFIDNFDLGQLFYDMGAAVGDAIIFILDQIIGFLEFLHTIPDRLQDIQETISTRINDFIENLKGIWDDFVEFMHTIPDRIYEALQRLYDRVMEGIDHILLKFDEFILYLQELPDKAYEALINLKDRIIETLNNIRDDIIQWIEDVKQWFHDGLENIKQKFDEFIEYLTTLPERIMEWLRKAFDEALEYLRSVPERLQEIWDTIKQAFEDFLEWLSTIPERLYQLAVDMWDNFIEGIESRMPGITERLQRIRDLLPGSNAKAGPLSNIMDAVTALKDFAISMVNAIIEGIRERIPDLRTALQQLRDILPGSNAKTGPLNNIMGIISSMRSTVSRMMESIIQSIRSGVPNVQSALQQLRNLFPFSNAKTGPLRDIMTWGKNIANNILSSLQNHFPKIVDYISNVMNKIEDKMKVNLDINTADFQPGRFSIDTRVSHEMQGYMKPTKPEINLNVEVNMGGVHASTVAQSRQVGEEVVRTITKEMEHQLSRKGISVHNVWRL